MTRVYKNLLNQWRESLKEQWAQGQFASDNREEMVTANFQALAEVSVLNKLAALEYEDLVSALTEK